MGERSREKDSLLLTAGKLADLAIGEIGHADELEAMLGVLTLGLPRAANPAEFAVGTHQDDVECIGWNLPVGVAALGNVGDALTHRSIWLPEESHGAGAAEIKPSADLISVDLPAPLGPMIAASLPEGISRSMSQSTGFSRHVTVRSRTTIATESEDQGECVIGGALLSTRFKSLVSWGIREEGVDVLANHADVGAFRCAILAHCVGEELPADSDISAAIA